jgi:hypothetical protein
LLSEPNLDSQTITLTGSLPVNIAFNVSDFTVNSSGLTNGGDGGNGGGKPIDEGLDLSTWTLVRRVQQGNQWHDARDFLAGTHPTYGTPCGGTDDCTFGIPFEQDDFDEFLFATGDSVHWMIMKKEAVYT